MVGGSGGPVYHGSPCGVGVRNGPAGAGFYVSWIQPVRSALSLITGAVMLCWNGQTLNALL